MKPPLGDTLVICDMDNTLLTAKEGIPACNRAVIRLYTGMGGLFTVATGRPPESIRAALGNLKLSLPAISCNGALLYDFSTESVLHRSTLNREQATTAIIDILAKFPRMGVEVMAGNGEMYVIHANEVTHAHQVDEHLGSIACLLGATVLGLPVSTTHTRTCALLGVGSAGGGRVDRRVAGEVALAWLLTFPGCGAVGYWSARLFLAVL